MASVCSLATPPFRPFDIWRDDPRSSILAMDHIRHRFTVPLAGRKRRNVIDLGCGDGYLSYLLARRGHSVTAIDSDSRRLEKFKDEAARFDIRQVCLDFSTVPPGAFQADVLYCMEVLEHIRDIEAAIDLAKSFIRPGGRGVFSVPIQENLFEGLVACPNCGHEFHRDGHVHSFKIGELDHLLEARGFVKVRHWIFQSVFTRQLQLATRLAPGRTLLAADRIFCGLFPRLGRRYIATGLSPG